MVQKLILPSDSPTRWPVVRAARDLTHNTLNDSLSLAKTWLEECISQHEPCAPESNVLPTRVIDVGSAGTDVRLIRLGKGGGQDEARLRQRPGDYHR